MQRVLVISTTKQPLMPCHPARARELLKRGKAAVFRRFPFTIILKEREAGDTQPARLKIDPGSKETGIALVNETTRKVVFAMVLVHRGRQISEALTSRRAVRRSRRNRKTRYRKPGLPNTQKQQGWLAPSLLHRVLTTRTWVNRLSKWSPVSGLSMELVRFDLQKMENPEISGVEYQQGTLFGFEVKEYLLLKWGHRCAYCGEKNVPLEVEHVVARTNGGSDRVSNLAIACRDCNEKKGKLPVETFLKDRPDVLKKIKAQLKAPLRDATAVNSIRWRLLRELKNLGLDVEVGSGGRTKWNRTRLGYPKEHWIDAACVGISGSMVIVSDDLQALRVKAVGHGCRQVTRTDRFGFPRQKAKKGGPVFGFQTGDIVKAVVLRGKKIGTYTGKVAVRASGSFNIQTVSGCVQGVGYRLCRLLHRKDGYSYC